MCICRTGASCTTSCILMLFFHKLSLFIFVENLWSFYAMVAFVFLKTLQVTVYACVCLHPTTHSEYLVNASYHLHS